MTVTRPVGRERWRVVTAGITLFLLCFGTAGCGIPGLYGVALPGGAALGDHPYEVTIEFADVLDLVPQAAVKVNDVAVGQVKEIRLRDWTAVVVVVLNGDVELPANAVAELRQSSLLGEKFISISKPTEGAAATPLADGDTIPLARSGRNPEVEEVLSALSLVLNGGGLPQLQTIAQELGTALQGREDGIRRTLEELTDFVGGLDDQKAEIVRAIDSIDALTAKLAAQKETIATGLTTIGPGLQVLTDQRPQLVDMLGALQNLGTVATRVITETKDDVVADLQLLQPILTQLVAAGDSLPKSLDLMLTYPFPQSSVNAIRGDYTNLNADFDLSVSDLLNNLGLTGQLEQLGLLSALPLPLGSPNPLPIQADVQPAAATDPATSVPGLPGVGAGS